jgi:hypothetical protein
MILCLMLLLRWLLVVRGQFQHNKLERLQQLGKIRRENGSRDDLLGSNSHSNGDIFSRSSTVSIASISIYLEYTY